MTPFCLNTYLPYDIYTGCLSMNYNILCVYHKMKVLLISKRDTAVFAMSLLSIIHSYSVSNYYPVWCQE